MKLPLSLLVIWVLATTSHAAIITNAIQGVGPNNGIRPYLCLQNADGDVTLELAPDHSGDANLASGQSDRARAHLRFAGCNRKDEDLGVLELSIGEQVSTPSVLNYTAPDGIHIAYINANMNAQGKIMGNIVYTSIQANFNLSPVKSTQHTMFTGVNLSGLEFGQAILPSTIPNLSQQEEDTPYSDLADIQAFIHAGMNTVRIPISWNYLQWNGPGRTIINQNYYSNYIKPLLETLTSAKVYTILNLHCNMHYAMYGQTDSICPKYGYCPSGILILDESAYTYLWGQLWHQIKQDADINPNYLLLDLFNAPVHVPDDIALTIQTTLIKHLRQSGFPGYILVQGNAGSDLHSWTTHQWMSQDGQSLSNASLFTRDNFLQAGISDLSKILISVRQYFDEGYQGTHSDCLQDLSTTGPDGFNLEAFTQYLKENQLQAIVTAVGVGKNACTCTTALTQFMAYIQQHAADNQPFGFVGWAMWGVGHAWGDYPLRFTPESELMQVLGPFIPG